MITKERPAFMGRGLRVLVRVARASATVGGLIILGAAPLLAQEEHGGGGGGLFDINPGLIVWTWVVFIVLLIVLRKWAWGPILGALETREKRIQEALDSAARDRDEAARLLDEHRRMMQESREQAQNILADSRKAAERLRSEMVEEARREKDRIVGGAKEEIERERDQALDALRREAVDLSITAASRVLERNLDSEENRRLVEGYLERLASERQSG